MKTTFFSFFFLTVQFCCTWVCCLNLLGGDSIYGASSPRMSTGVSRWLSSQLGTSGLSLQVASLLSTTAFLQFAFFSPGTVHFGGRNELQPGAQVDRVLACYMLRPRYCQEMGTLYINYKVREEVKLCLHI